jgi:exopolysaccharide biosynthesis polyprenyl glycosylphosphotransferase
MQATQDKIASIDVLSARRGPSNRLPQAVSKGVAGSLCGVGDLAILTAVLIYLALSANGFHLGDSLIDLLAIKLSIDHFFILIVCWSIWRMTFCYCGLYAWQHGRSPEGIVGRLTLTTGICAVVAGSVIAAFWHHSHFWHNTLIFWSAANCGAISFRVVIAAFQLYVRPHFRSARNVIIVGSGARTERIYKELMSHPEWNYKLLGFVDSRPLTTTDMTGRRLGGISHLEEILMRQVVDEVVITLSMRSQYAAIERVIDICERAGVQLQYCADVFETSIVKQVYSEDHDHRRVVLKMVHDDYRRHLKRALDIAGALFGIILLAPLFLIVAVCTKATSKGPVVFRQERYGLNKRTFYIYKFRSMIVDAEASQAKYEHLNQNMGPVFKIFADPRVTKVGAFLRKTSIDELPQLFNVLKGEMSLVGPRPLNLRDVGKFSEAWLMRRFSVKPGLTCIWQVSGRSDISFDRWIALDLHYIDHWSLLLDMKILAMTFPAVLKGRGAA